MSNKNIVKNERLESLSFLRSKIYGNVLSDAEIREIIFDIVANRYSDIHLSSFVTACAGDNLNREEIFSLTKAMIESGEKLEWEDAMIVDKHCIGGLPGNRVTPIVVSIVAEFGLTMPKTSSRAITSPAGTADTMEVLTGVSFDIDQIKKIIAQEKGCVVWGGSVHLSPADDILIRIERALDFDGEGQMVASILSKKIAAGSNHILIDIPVGETVKVRSQKKAEILRDYLEDVAKKMDVKVKVIFSDGSQPVGNGIGPALEARDVLLVLQNNAKAPQDLRERALKIAGEILEFSPQVKIGEGKKIAAEILNDGRAWKKFQAICQAQGGMKEIATAQYVVPVLATKNGVVSEIDNRQIATLAKLAGAPFGKICGLDFFVRINSEIKKGDAIFAIHSESQDNINAALDYFNENLDLIKITEK